MNLDVAVAASPYERVAGRPFQLDWTLAYDDGSPNGAPEDVSDVTEAIVTAELRVDRGDAAVTKRWMGGQVDLSGTLTIGGIPYPRLVVSENTGLTDVGLWDLKVTLIRAGGFADFVLKAQLLTTEQPQS